MADQLRELKNMVGAVLADTPRPTPSLIRERIQQVRALYLGVTDEQAEKLAREFEAMHGVTMEIGSKLEEKGFEQWLVHARADIDFYYWGRYQKLLGKKEFSGQVLATLDDVTNRTLGLLENPDKRGKWDRRGMVVGHVQSGKTANYTGLICKAADAGYRIIVIIAGIHNNLRSQTQMRIEEGFIGRNSSNLMSNSPHEDSVIGVGRFDSRRRPNVFTTTLRDFDKATATSLGIPLQNLKEPVVFVIKKQYNTLKNLLEWLREHNMRYETSSIDEPMLLLDDEADNASINIKRGSDEVSRINGQIRQILGVFDRSCYVGYTATPFANIFIEPDTVDAMFGEDLFPRDFIINLDPPGNYFGATRVFLDESDEQEQIKKSIIRYIEDNGDWLPLKHNKQTVVSWLPESLIQAIRTFIVARAIRIARGQAGDHNSMLVNVSRFVNVQRQVRNELHDLISHITVNIRVNGAKEEKEALLDLEIKALHDVFSREYRETCNIQWKEVRQHLLASISPIDVIEVNSQASGSLDYAAYEKGRNVIAVGGLSLSRGLTLEGLLVSYFLRNSQMYDTLMQMGRWFGYRPGYEDLCRIWMLEEAEGWYTHIAASIEELRDEFRRMEAQNATPREFGLKVRSHPDTLIVTARNKMGSGERSVVSIGLGNQFIETAILRLDQSSRQINLQAVLHLADTMRKQSFAPEMGKVPKEAAGGRLVRRVPVDIILDFLAAFQNHPGSPLTETEPVRRYIEDRAATELAIWDVLFAGVQKSSESSLIYNGLGFELFCQRRTPGSRTDSKTLFVTNKQRVSSRGIEKVGLSDEQIRKTEEKYRNANPPRDGRTPNYPDHVFRHVRTYPLLVVHLLAIGKKDEDLSGNEPVAAWSISFPVTKREEKKVEYVVNTTWFRERYQDEVDDDEMEGDDD